MNIGINPTAYRLTKVDDTRCKARKCGTVDMRWKPALMHEAQCQNAPGTNGICDGCAKVFEMESATGKYWHWQGRVDEEPADYVHMPGTAWASKCKWKGVRLGLQCDSDEPVQTVQQVQPASPIQVQPASPIQSPVQVQPTSPIQSPVQVQPASPVQKPYAEAVLDAQTAVRNAHAALKDIVSRDRVRLKTFEAAADAMERHIAEWDAKMTAAKTARIKAENDARLLQMSETKLEIIKLLLRM